ncbi:MAG: polymer-forming cytoskeletal protein [Pseudomonadota bacterium]
MFRRKPNSNPDIDSLLGGTTDIQGDLLFSGGLHLDGSVTGSVKAKGDGVSRLVVGESAVIAGSVEAPIVELYGVVRGDIVAVGRVVMGPRGRVEGNLQYGALEVAAGASIKGKLVKLDTSGGSK